MTDRYDALVIGAGHNGLVCASYLAKAGRKVLVLEANEMPGGCAATREFTPGYSVSSCAQWLSQLHPDVSRDLALEQHGLKFAARDLATIALDTQGAHLTASGSKIKGEKVSAEDCAAFEAFHIKTAKYLRLLARMFAVRAPELVEANLTDRLTLLKLGLEMKLLGRNDMSDLMRIILINMYDLMEESFDSEQLQGMLSLDGVLGARMGPRTPGTVLGYLYHRLGEAFGCQGRMQVAGGMGALGEAMAASVKAAGVELRHGSPVARIDLQASQVQGVTLANGGQLTAPLIISNADPVSTFACLVGYDRMETETARRVSQIRCKGITAKLHLALQGLPRFSGLDKTQQSQRLIIAPDMDYVERAFNAVKYDECSAAPALDISIPTLHDPALAPGGGHVLSAIVQFAPHAPGGGWESQREAFTQRIIDTIAAYAPGIREHIVAAELLTPADLERDYGMTGGHWHHGELSLDQIMMMRPYPGATQYGTAIDGLYLCGAGTHPGGGVMGLAGRNAAREIIRREGRA